MNLQEIRKQIPHGAFTVIAKKAGVSKCTVSQVLNGKSKSPKMTEIMQATAEFMAEYIAAEKKAMEAINNVFNPVTQP